MTDTTDAPVVAPPRKERGTAARIATGVAEQGFGVDPDASEPAPHAGLRLAGLLGALVLVGVLNRWMLVVILGIVLMITLHELGHFVMAKRAGMKVTEFFLGFGPKIWSTRRGETEYGIKAIPAGAYVKIIGMTNLEEVPPQDEGRTYRQKTFRQRLGVAVAGSTMHFLLALVLIYAALVVVGQPAGTIDPRVADRQWTIGAVSPGTGAADAGLRPGDRIVRIDGKELDGFSGLRKVTKPLKGKTVPVVYERDGASRSTSVTLKPFYSWYVDRVVPRSGVAQAGLEPGDQILSIDGRATIRDKDLSERLSALEGRKVPVAYEDVDGRRRTTDVEISSMILVGNEGYVGIGRADAPSERVNPAKALVQAPKDFVNITGLSLQGLGRFFTPGGVSDFAGQVANARDDQQEARKANTGPKGDRSSARLSDSSAGAPSENRLLSLYGLVRIGSDVGGVDPGALISLFALINIFIGVFNLVPLLPFDGGHVVIAAYEKVQEVRLRRRRYFADVGRLLPVVYAVTALLAVLFISTLYLDIANPLSTK